MSTSPGLLLAARSALAAGLGITLVLGAVLLSGPRTSDPSSTAWPLARPLLAQSAPPPPLVEEPPSRGDQPGPVKPPSPSPPTKTLDPAFEPLPVNPAPPPTPEPNELPMKSPIDLAADALLGVLEESFEQVGDQLAEIRRRLDLLLDAHDLKRQAELERLNDLVKRLESEAARRAEPAEMASPDETPQRETPAGQARDAEPGIRILQDATSGRLTLDIRHADLSEVLRRLGQATHKSILPDPDANIPITVYLHEVAPDDAFKVLLETHGCVATETVSGIRIARRARQPDGSTASKKLLVTKLYRTRHLSTQDLERIVSPLLTPGIGRSSTVGSRSDCRPGGDCGPTGAALLVVDQPDVLSQVDRILQELDVPGHGW